MLMICYVNVMKMLCYCIEFVRTMIIYIKNGAYFGLAVIMLVDLEFALCVC